MSFEETMVCDGCSTVLSGGPRGAMYADLIAQGGQSYTVDDRPRHLCAGCVGREAFFDGVPVPERREGRMLGTDEQRQNEARGESGS